MIKESESEVLSSCLKTLSAFGIFAWRSNNMGTYRHPKGRDPFYSFNGLRGVSDILGVLPDGRILCVECKATGKLKDQKPEQKRFQEYIERNGGMYWLIDSFEMLTDLIDKNGLRRR